MPGCSIASASCPRKRVFSRNLDRWVWLCECGKAFADFGDKPASMPLRGDPVPGIDCPICSGPMVLVSGARNGDFYSCASYPACHGTREIKKSK